ncbi:MAG: general secretion pathway protein F/type IV pilus assembly protein PilC [Verrucomicrobia bacterium]|nr:MAG: general secretion pathway protein F/type IV pilus assembly protein PilC [Verrucomicrobiota bacterium]
MATFRYSAYASDGQLATGTLEASDRGDAVRELSARRLQPVSLAPVENPMVSSRVPAAAAKNRETKEALAPTVVHLNAGQVTMFVEELAQLLAGGIQLEPALGIMERRRELSGLKVVAGLVRTRLRDGQSFAGAVQVTSPSFGEMFCNLASAGEMSGSLAAVLKRQAAYLKSIQELKSRVLAALIYPAFLLFSAVSVAILFVVFLIPKLMELLDSTGGSLPVGAQLILGVSEFAKATWWIWAVLGTGLTLTVRWWASQERNRPAWDHFVLRVPLFGRLIRERFYVQFLETLCNLVANGLPLNRALELTKAATPDRYLRRHLEAVIAQVDDGLPLSSALDRTGEFPSLLTDMLAVGEETGDLAAALGRTAERYDGELKKRAERLSALIQPVVVVAMASLVGAMAYLMITAIFQTIAGLNQ